MSDTENKITFNRFLHCPKHEQIRDAYTIIGQWGLESGTLRQQHVSTRALQGPVHPIPSREPAMSLLFLWWLFFLGPKQSSTCEVPITFVVMTFLSQMIAFFTAWIYRKRHQTWYKNLAKNVTIELCGISWYRPHLFKLTFFFFFLQIGEMLQTYFFELLLGNFTNLHKTLRTASVDSPDKKLLQKCWYFKQYSTY